MPDRGICRNKYAWPSKMVLGMWDDGQIIAMSGHSGRRDLESRDYVPASLLVEAEHAVLRQVADLAAAIERNLNDHGPWGRGYAQALADLREQLALRFPPESYPR